MTIMRLNTEVVNSCMGIKRSNMYSIDIVDLMLLRNNCINAMIPCIIVLLLFLFCYYRRDTISKKESIDKDSILFKRYKSIKIFATLFIFLSQFLFFFISILFLQMFYLPEDFIDKFHELDRIYKITLLYYVYI